MHALTQLTIGISAAVTTVTLIFMAIELQQLRTAVQRLRRGGSGWGMFGTSIPHTGTTARGKHGYALYIYRGSRWHLEADFSDPGCEVHPPAMEGSYEGQVIKKEARPRP